MFSGGSSKGRKSSRTCLISERLVPRPPVVTARLTGRLLLKLFLLFASLAIRGSMGGPVTTT